MKTRKLTRKQAWKFIGAELLRRGTKLGICNELDRLANADRITERTYDEMDDQLQEYVSDEREAGNLAGGYLYGTWNEDRTRVIEFGYGRYHAERAMGCFWLAQEAA